MSKQTIEIVPQGINRVQELENLLGDLLDFFDQPGQPDEVELEALIERGWTVLNRAEEAEDGLEVEFFND